MSSVTLSGICCLFKRKEVKKSSKKQPSLAPIYTTKKNPCIYTLWHLSLPQLDGFNSTTDTNQQIEPQYK